MPHHYDGIDGTNANENRYRESNEEQEDRIANENRNPEGDSISPSLAHYRAHQGLDGVIQSRARLTHTHTTVGLMISPETFDEIATKLRAANYGHVFSDEDHMDLTGIELVRESLNPMIDGKIVARTERPDPNARQVGGAHYGLSQFQHWDMVALFKLDYFQGQVTKYVMRWRDKNGVEDLEKAQHYLEKYIAVERAKHPKEPDSPARIG